MQAFENKLAELNNSKKRNKKPEIDKEISLLLNDQIQKAPEFEKFLSIVEKQSISPKLLSIAIMSGLEKISEDKKKELMESLKSRYQKPIIYQIIAELLTQDSSAQVGMELFSYCCDKITDNGKKAPQPIINKMKNAFEDNSLNFLSERDLSKNMMICFLNLIFNQKKVRYPLIIEKSVVKASKIWEGLPQEDRRTYANCIKDIFKGKAIDDILINKELKKDVSPEFMKAVSLSDKEDLSEKKSDTRPLPSQKDQVKQFVPSEEKKATEPESVSDKEHSVEAASPSEGKKVAKPESVSNKKPQSFPSQKEEQYVKPPFDPVQAMNDIVAWLEPVLQAQKLFKWVEKKDDEIRAYKETEGKLRRDIDSLKAHNISLKDELEKSEQIIKGYREAEGKQRHEIDSLKADNRDLNNKIKDLVNLKEQNRNEIDTLKEKIETDKQFYQERMKTFGRESEEREKRLISEMKNRMASRLQPLIDRFNFLKQASDMNDREESLIITFDNMVNMLKSLLNTQRES